MNAIGKGGQGVPDGIAQAHGLDGQAPQLCEDGAAAVGLVVSLTPFLSACQDPDFRQTGQLATDIGGILPQQQGKPAPIKTLIRVGKEPPQDLGAKPGAQQTRQHATTLIAVFFTEYAVNSTTNDFHVKSRLLRPRGPVLDSIPLILHDC